MDADKANDHELTDNHELEKKNRDLFNRVVKIWSKPETMLLAPSTARW